MPDQNQPTIPVKQDDGSVKEVPLDEFKEKYQQDEQPSEPQKKQEEGSQQRKEEEKQKEQEKEQQKQKIEEKKQKEGKHEQEKQKRQKEKEPGPKEKQEQKEKETEKKAEEKKKPLQEETNKEGKKETKELKEEKKKEQQKEPAEDESEPKSEEREDKEEIPSSEQEKDGVEEMKNKVQKKKEKLKQKQQTEQEKPKQQKKKKKQKKKESETKKKKQRQQWDKQDRQSPLEEKEPEVKGSILNKMTKGASMTDDEELRDVLTDLSFDIDPGLFERARSLISSRRKGVRDNSKLREYAVNDPNKGGLGLEEEQADEFVDTVVEYFDLKTEDKIVSQEEKQKDKDKKKKTEKTKKKKEKQKEKEQQPQEPTSDKGGLEFKQNGELDTKMQDIKPPEEEKTVEKQKEPEEKPSRSMGPVDEIANMKWEHFRYLSDDPDKAAEKLLKKFMLLHDESFLLFLEAREKWFDCPLFVSYQKVLKQSVNNKKPVSGILDSKEGEFSMEELKALVDINKELT